MAKGYKSYEEVLVEDKLDYYKKNNPFVEDRFNEKVECLHCGENFIFNEFKVIRETSPKGDEFIVCKHFPKCNGSLIDFVPASKRRRS
jgi:ssDNA-binding Zn-finger/Zn-ribbon topoisomerase 1